MKRTFLASLLAIVGLLPILSRAQLTVGTLPTSGLGEPYNLATDDSYNIYVTDSANSAIFKFDASTLAMSLLVGSAGAGYVDGPAYAAEFSNPQGMIYATIGRTNVLIGGTNVLTGGTSGLIVVDTDNGVIRFVRTSDGYVSTLAGNTNGPLVDSSIGRNATFYYPYGITADTNGNAYIADWGHNAIRVINLNDPNFGVTSLAVTNTTFVLNRPKAVAFGGSNQLWVADTGNHVIRLVTLSNPTNGSQTSYLGGFRSSGSSDSGFGANARFNTPSGLLWDPGVGLLISDTGNNTIRLATNNANYGVTNYAVATFAGVAGPGGSANGSALSATFNSPFGMVRDIPNGRYLLADALNHAIRIIQYGPVLGTCPIPSIGYITFVFDVNQGQFVSVLNTDPPFTFNNDIPVGISYPLGYNAGYTLDGTLPNKSSPTPNRYYEVNSTLNLGKISVPINYNSNVLITAFTWNVGQPSSPATNALFRFITATPQFIGQNAAEFQISCITSGALLYYTTDGSDPTVLTTNVYTASFDSATGLHSFNMSSNNFLLKCFTRRVDATHNYMDSTVASNFFSAANYVPNSIGFGLTNGEPHSSFLARPGQTFYAPVTLRLTPNFGTMFSLQFNVTVTNGFTNILSGKQLPPLINATGLGFFSMLMSKVPAVEGQYYPPADGNWYLPIPPDILVTSNTPPIPAIFTNSSLNLLGVGWFYRSGFKYSYVDSAGNYQLDFDTTHQDLIQYSIPHDTLFGQANGLIVVGTYSFQVPASSVIGDQYSIQLGSPSATSDGVGAPGAGIYIQPPATGQVVTVESPAYVVGDAAPFHWLNAGDFGDGTLDNSDVMQVYQCAIVGVNMPPQNSDLYAAMDSAGGLGTFDAADAYWTNSVLYTNSYGAGGMTNLWDGNDPTINQMPFGDGILDINDLYVTFRRSLDPSLIWFKRYWTNGMFVAVTNINYAFNSNTPHLRLPKSGAIAKNSTGATPDYLNSSVVFSAGDAVAAAGSTLQIPITASVFGSYPLRVLGLNLAVHALDGSPDLTQQVTFTPSAAVGTPSINSSKSLANFSAAWLDATIPGLSNNVTLGTLTVTLPTNATSSSAYAVHFDFASGSPNGLAVFPNLKFTGLITTTARTNSTYQDGIPDSWRLRWFGTIYNQLSVSNACAAGDGVNNWLKYVAGVDPNVANDFPSVNPRTPVPVGATTAIHWPSVSGKQYAIERANSLFNAPWTILSTNSGTGGDLEFDDTNTATMKFYRVRILP